MFEDHQSEVAELMQKDAEFRSLYYRHRELNSKVHDAEIGVLPIDEATLRSMKFEKLHAKEKLTQMWESAQAAS